MSTETKAAHTPTPWKKLDAGEVSDDGHWESYLRIGPDEENEVARVGCQWWRYGNNSGSRVSDDDIREANLEHILRCVNSHDDLLAACKRLLRSFHPITHHDSEDYKFARAAIAKAEGR